MLTGQILGLLIVILIVVQIFGYLCKRIGQQWVIGEILAGLALGPSLFGWLFPGIKGLLFPLGIGAGTALFLFPTLAGPKANVLSFTLLIGTAMSITAFPVLARILS